MAGLSLECGDCQAQLRSVEEAQEHAELTGHTNFQESTQAVLNLVCTTCGKPCRTQTEQDLHTKRTGHADFADKTAETAKPIVLETKPAAGPSGSGAEGSAGGAPEMIVPEVNKEALAELELMGFPAARSTRALHFTGSSNVETAVNWIVEHESDPDIDEMPLVAADSNTSIQSLLTPEEAKAKAQELVVRAKRKKEEEERRMEKERERERIRIGKELQEARRIEEQQERQRIIAFRKAEKDEEQRARLKIRQKVEEDKAERRRKLGLPPEDPKTAEAAPPPQEEKKPFVPLRPASKAEQMRECLRGLKHAHKDEDARVKKAFQTMLTYIGNVAQNPNEEKYRKIRLTNAAFQERVGSLQGGLEFLQLCGFERDGAEFLFLPREKVDAILLNVAGSELTSAINNPFFGVLFSIPDRWQFESKRAMSSDKLSGDDEMLGDDEMSGDERGHDVVEIINSTINMNKYVDLVRDPGAGAISTFLGTTRDTFEDKQVVELRYEAYHAMAVEQLRRICTAARDRWALTRIAIVHRVGVVGIGEASVLIVVSSVHRKESLHACEFLIDELKTSVPIWKKEVYQTGETWKQNAEFLNRSNRGGTRNGDPSVSSV